MKSGTGFFDRPLTRTRIKSANVKPVESLLGYLVGPFCAMLANGIFTTYLTRYFRDVLFAEELASGSSLAGTVEGFLTVFPILSAILIVIGNLVAGQLVERTRTGAGKARPWILLSAVLLAVAGVLIFIQPSDDPIFKMVWLVVAYNLYYAVAFPLYNTANSTLTPLSTRNSNQRSVLASFVNMALLGAVGAGSMVFPFLLGILIKPEMSLGTQKTFWMMLFVIVGVITFLGTVMQYYFTRERVTEEETGRVAVQKKPGIGVGKQAKAAVGDRYFWVIIVFYFLYQFSGGIKNTSLNFYAEILATEGFPTDSVTGVLGIIGAVPMAVAVFFVAPLCNKFGKRNMCVIGMLVGVIGGVIAGIGYDNMVVASLGIALKCLGSAPAGYMILAMIADSLDHIEAKCGFRCDGLVMSVYSSVMIASTPVAQGITSALVGTGETGTVIAYIWIETVCYGLGAILLLFFNVEKYLNSDRETVLARQKAEAEAAGLEWLPPEERLRIEEEESERLAEAARIEELKVRCQKKGLDFEAEEEKYRKKQEAKRAAKHTKPPRKNASD